MFHCMPCLRLRSRDVNANVSDITNCMSDISLRATANDNKGKEKEERADEEDEMSTEWAAEEEQGVLITFISLPNGGNHLKKIRFSEEYFDNREANKWWHDNCERIMSLYSVEYPTSTQQYQSDDELQQIQYNNRLSEERQGNWNIGECSHSNSNDQCGDEGEEQSKEVVVEDYPGVYLHIIELSDGTKELTRIQFSREMFGEVKARVWWEENKARLSKLYSSSRDS